MQGGMDKTDTDAPWLLAQYSVNPTTTKQNDAAFYTKFLAAND